MKVILLFLISTLSVAGQTSNVSSLSADDIFLNCRRAYAGLTSYSDKGSSIIDWSGVVESGQFSSKMSRPAFYRVSYTVQGHPAAAWNAGSGDFINRVDGSVQNEELEFTRRGITDKAQIRKLSLTDVMSSPHIETMIPGIFFDALDLNPLTLPGNKTALPDEPISGTDCYVIEEQWAKTNRLRIWIGKTDFLIRQIRQEKPGTPHIFLTETHYNIVVNSKFLPKDFLQ